VLESPEPDPARPTPAGIYDYLLRGQHYSAADQAAAEQAVAMTPATRSEVIENRAFLRRAVRYLARRGITQYLDLGSGYPASGAVHQTAAELITSPRVVYVDHDPRVAEISRGLLDSPDTAVIVRDVRRPAEIIGDPQTQRRVRSDHAHPGRGGRVPGRIRPGAAGPGHHRRMGHRPAAGDRCGLGPGRGRRRAC
jgi:hypothetical protein